MSDLEPIPDNMLGVDAILGSACGVGEFKGGEIDGARVKTVWLTLQVGPCGHDRIDEGGQILELLMTDEMAQALRRALDHDTCVPHEELHK